MFTSFEVVLVIQGISCVGTVFDLVYFVQGSTGIVTFTKVAQFNLYCAKKQSTQLGSTKSKMSSYGSTLFTSTLKLDENRRAA